MINPGMINTNTQYIHHNPKIQRKYSGIGIGDSQQGTDYVGRVFPFFCRELIPSEKQKLKASCGMQFSPFVSQLFARMSAEILGYKLPYRVIIDKYNKLVNSPIDWESFITGGKDGKDLQVMPSIGNLDALVYLSLFADYASSPLMDDQLFDLYDLGDTRLWVKRDVGYIAVPHCHISDDLFDYDATVYLPRVAVFEHNGSFGFWIAPSHIESLSPEDAAACVSKSTGVSDITPDQLRDNLNDYMYGMLQHTLWDDFGIGMPEIMLQQYVKPDNAAWDVLNGFVLPCRVVGLAKSNQVQSNWSPYEGVFNFGTNYVNLMMMYRPGNLDYRSLVSQQMGIWRLAEPVNITPFAMYNIIYNDVLRWPDLEPERTLINIFTFRGHEQNNYFTRARIYQQRGVSPQVPVDVGFTLYDGDGRRVNSGTLYDTPISFNTNSDKDLEFYNGSDEYKLTADSSTFNVEDVLTAMILMRYQVNNAKMPSRYIDHLKYRFGITGLDARLQLPEFLGSFSQTIMQNNIIQTAPNPSDESTGLGNITSIASVTGNNGVFNVVGKEHEVVMLLCVVRPDMVIEQGVPKWLTKVNRFDFVIPELVDSPDVPIRKSEIQGLSPCVPVGQDLSESEFAEVIETCHSTFAWTSIYDDYRTSINRITGRLRPSDKRGLRSFTLAQQFGYNVGFNADFVRLKPLLDRVKQYINEPDFLYFASVSIATAQPLPIESEPGQFAV